MLELKNLGVLGPNDILIFYSEGKPDEDLIRRMAEELRSTKGWSGLMLGAPMGMKLERLPEDEAKHLYDMLKQQFEG